MKLFVLTEEEINKAVAGEIISLIKQKPNCVLGLATGSTPVGVYQELARNCQEGKVSFKNVKSYNLDEYVGLDVENDQSYHYFMRDNLFDHIDIDLNNTHVPDGINFEKSVKEYDKEIENAGGIDLQILGIGSNGHIAFNEPGTPFDSLTHVVDLKESTIKDNSRFFASIDDVPRKAISMGLASILRAKKIILIAKGSNKAEAIRRLFKEEATIDLPASSLQKHPDVEIFCDPLAAELLK